MVEAHLEELTEPGITDERRAALAADPRPRVVIAALHYLVTERDAVPDWLPTGHLDDLLILQWATDVARGDLPLV
nr:YkvA family protein [Flexivirga meconopsidis]